MPPVEEFAPFWEHVGALRRTLGRMLLVVACGVAVSFYFHGEIIRGLTSPFALAAMRVAVGEQPEKIDLYRLANTSPHPQTFRLPHGGEPSSASAGVQLAEGGEYVLPPGGSLTYSLPQPKAPPLVVLGPVEGMVVALKTSLWVGLVATSPFWLWIGFQFVVPALTQAERRLVVPFFALSFWLVAFGGALTFFVTIPLANSYLMAFNQELGLNLWSLSHYLDYTLFLLLANGLAFEFFAVGLLAVQLGLLDAAWLRSKRRAAVVMALIVGALLTPPDVLTQLMLAVPLILLYEGVILYALLRQRPRTRS